MSRATWTAVDAFIENQLLDQDPVLDAVLQHNAAAGLPSIDVSAAQGKLLYLLAKIAGARRVLEIGTLGGYSTIWLARALPPDGTVVTLEIDPIHARVAAGNIRKAGLAETVDIQVGPALDSLIDMDAAADGPFDFIFIDADKPNNPRYLEQAMRLSRPGTVIVCDNVIRDGNVIATDGADANVVGARAAFSFIGGHDRLEGTAIQTVGSKGYDGFAIAVVS